MKRGFPFRGVSSAINLLLAFCALIGFECFAENSARANSAEWQLTFEYNDQSLSLKRASRVSDRGRKVKVSPGLAGSVSHVDYEVEWLDSNGRSLERSSVTLPLGTRTTGAKGGCETAIETSGSVVIRTAGPGDATRVKLRNVSQSRHRHSRPLPPIFGSNSHDFPINRTALAELASATLTKIRDTGPDSNRLVFAILSEGYTESDLQNGLYAGDVERLVAHMQTTSPWDEVIRATNIYRIDVPSVERGADLPPVGSYVNTEFNASYYMNGIERLLFLDRQGSSHAAEVADQYIGTGVWDFIIVLVNSTKYGGGAGGGIAVISRHELSADILIHELGHSFAGLADEYDLATYGGSHDTHERNVDVNPLSPKWSVWMDDDVPLPTPEIADYRGKVGAFEGAKYQSQGVYRPTLSCGMGELGAHFCPICSEAHVLTLAERVGLVDEASPLEQTMSDLSSGPVIFLADGPNLPHLSYIWKLCGETRALTAEPAFSVAATDLSRDRCQLELEIRYNSLRVRSQSIQKSVSWNVCRGGGCVAPQLAVEQQNSRIQYQVDGGENCSSLELVAAERSKDLATNKRTISIALMQSQSAENTTLPEFVLGTSTLPSAAPQNRRSRGTKRVHFELRCDSTFKSNQILNVRSPGVNNTRSLLRKLRRTFRAAPEAERSFQFQSS